MIRFADQVSLRLGARALGASEVDAGELGGSKDTCQPGETTEPPELDNAPLHAGVAVRSRWHGCGRRLAVGVRVLETLSGKSNPDDLLSGGASLKRLARSSY
ncbi:hypothetical protein T4A_14279 [Trichinella pseudospiralis]|uniref:Uncharacterized protein n=1 Tax=Trichinella pseudospiralis TaxID=6337 RepID=A0A0V1E1X6_TRIPS|nr:hypothetical protein T4A_14279 [Trichinella pseudospiralis]